MTNPVTTQDYAALLESLRVTEECQEIFNETISFKRPLDTVSLYMAQRNMGYYEREGYLLERLRRAEANRKPPTLLEDVKACMRAGMDAEVKLVESLMPEYIQERRNINHDKVESLADVFIFRKLSEAGDK